MDPILEPVLAKSFIKRGNQTLIKLGDKEVDYNFDFKLYITTKLANPHYTPEISTKVVIVNFAVKEQGLEAQLLNLVVKNERPDLDKQKNDLVIKVAAGKRTQVRGTGGGGGGCARGEGRVGRGKAVRRGGTG